MQTANISLNVICYQTVVHPMNFVSPSVQRNVFLLIYFCEKVIQNRTAEAKINNVLNQIKSYDE